MSSVQSPDAARESPATASIPPATETLISFANRLTPMNFEPKPDSRSIEWKLVWWAGLFGPLGLFFIDSAWPVTVIGLFLMSAASSKSEADVPTKLTWIAANFTILLCVSIAFFVLIYLMSLTSPPPLGD